MENSLSEEVLQIEARARIGGLTLHQKVFIVQIESALDHLQGEAGDRAMLIGAIEECMNIAQLSYSMGEIEVAFKDLFLWMMIEYF